MPTQSEGTGEPEDHSGLAMEIGPLVVIGLRLLIPLAILRYHLAGVIAAATIDAFDVVLLTFIDQGQLSNYHFVDKYLDMYYLTLAAFVCLSWKNTLAKRTGVLLFLYRAAGFTLFEATQIRFLLFVFPNLFENFYLFYLGYTKFLRGDPVTSKKRLFVWLAVLLVPKMAQEYLLHVMQAEPWNWIRFHLLGMS